jgi:hypothetical protein
MVWIVYVCDVNHSSYDVNRLCDNCAYLYCSYVFYAAVIF